MGSKSHRRSRGKTSPLCWNIRWASRALFGIYCTIILDIDTADLRFRNTFDRSYMASSNLYINHKYPKSLLGLRSLAGTSNGSREACCLLGYTNLKINLTWTWRLGRHWLFWRFSFVFQKAFCILMLRSGRQKLEY